MRSKHVITFIVIASKLHRNMLHICWISQQCMCRKIFYMIKIHGQLININEVTDFHGGFLIFSALRSNTRLTILYRAHEYLYMRKNI